LEEFDIINLTEAWAREETWKKIRNKYEWICIPAIRENKKGRAKGIIVAVRNSQEEKEINKRVLEIQFLYNKKR